MLFYYRTTSLQPSEGRLCPARRPKAAALQVVDMHGTAIATTSVLLYATPHVTDCGVCECCIDVCCGYPGHRQGSPGNDMADALLDLGNTSPVRDVIQRAPAKSSPFDSCSGAIKGGHWTTGAGSSMRSTGRMALKCMNIDCKRCDLLTARCGASVRKFSYKPRSLALSRSIYKACSASFASDDLARTGYAFLQLPTPARLPHEITRISNTLAMRAPRPSISGMRTKWSSLYRGFGAVLTSLPQLVPPCRVRDAQ